MTKSPQNKKAGNAPYESSRGWAERHLTTLKEMQDEYLDRYHDNKQFSHEMLTLLIELELKLGMFLQKEV